jgi:hypothetical protein
MAFVQNVKIKNRKRSYVTAHRRCLRCVLNTFVSICIYLSVVTILTNAKTPDKIIHSGAPVVHENVGHRARNSESASDRAKRKTKHIKRNKYRQRQREYEDLPNNIKNYHRRQDNQRKQQQQTKSGVRRQAEKRAEALNESAALHEELQLSIKAIKDEVYEYLKSDIDERMQIEVQNSVSYHRSFQARTNSANRTLRFAYGRGNGDNHVHVNDIADGGNGQTRSIYKWSLYGSKDVHKCPAGCSGHGICKTDKCHCYRMWEGVDCSLRKCPSGRAYTDKEYYDNYDDIAKRRRVHAYAVCSGRGYCDRKNGTCECIKGYEGSVCERSSCPVHNCNVSVPFPY